MPISKPAQRHPHTRGRGGALRIKSDEISAACRRRQQGEKSAAGNYDDQKLSIWLTAGCMCRNYEAEMRHQEIHDVIACRDQVLLCKVA
jgi:hypothetical protein